MSKFFENNIKGLGKAIVIIKDRMINMAENKKLNYIE